MEPFSPDRLNNTAGRGILTLQGGKGVWAGGGGVPIRHHGNFF